MLTMTEINDELKKNFMSQLRDIKDLPEDLARGYKAWVRGLVTTAGQQMTADMQSAQAQQASQQSPVPQEGAA